MSWFGWAQENPPRQWRVALGVLSGVSLLVAVIGGYLAWQYWDGPTALSSTGAYQVFGAIVGIEFFVALIGALLLQWRRRASYVSAWIALVVGVHFVPLATIFMDDWLYLLAALMVAAGLVGPIVARVKHVTTSAVVGVSVGAVLLAFALRGVLLVWL